MNILTIIALLLITGLVPCLWLLPKIYLRYAFFIAPILGLILIASLGLLSIGMLYINLSPGVISSLFIACFIITIFFRSVQLFEVLNGIRQHYYFLIIPIIFLALLINSPTHLLGSFYSAGQDEIQYVNNAIHILNHQHTGDSLDTLIPRVDHYLRDAQTINLVYSPTYRRGAEIFLAFVIYLTGIDPFVCFTTAALTALIVFLMAVPAICHAFLLINNRISVTCQLLIFLSNFWIILLLQGSLANLCSLGLILLAVTATPKLYVINGYRPKILIGLLISGPVIFYNEVAASLIFTPLLLVFIYFLFTNKKFILQFKNISAIALATIIFSHAGIIGLGLMTYGMLLATTSQSAKLMPLTINNIASVVGPIYGVYTYYSTNYINSVSSQFAVNFPILIIIFVFLICVLSIFSFLRNKDGSCATLGILLLILLIVIFHSALYGLQFMMVRSVQYTYTFIIIGLILAYSLTPRMVVKAIIFGLLLILSLLNFQSLYSSINHLIKYNERTDPIVFRFVPTSDLWISFLRAFKNDAGQPILITGYDSTAKPHLIASLLEPNPNFIGASIRKFWAMMPDTVVAQGIHKMNNNSNVGVIMLRSQDPVEWGEQKIIALHRNRFFPIGELIKKDQWSPIQVNINGEKLSEANKIIAKAAQIEIKIDATDDKIIDAVEIQFNSNLNKGSIQLDKQFWGEVNLTIDNKIAQFKLIRTHSKSFNFKLLSMEPIEIVQVISITQF